MFSDCRIFQQDAVLCCGSLETISHLRSLLKLSCLYPLTFPEFAYSEEVSTLTVGHVNEVNIKGDSDRVSLAPGTHNLFRLGATFKAHR